MNHLFLLICYAMRYTLLIGVYLSLCPHAFSQSPKTLLPKINIPSSPEAGMLGKFGDIPVGYYTGTAEISIPLYTIKEGDVEIPIALRYHSSGIKVEDQATWVGLGWDLSPGGGIIQEVRGLRDEFDNKLHYDPNSTTGEYALFFNRVNNAPPQCWNKALTQIGCAFYNFCQTSDRCGVFNPSQPGDDGASIIGGLLLGNGQPDIYHFDFGGNEGKFYIHPETGQAVQLNKKDQLWFTKTSSGISATTQDGTVYQFFAVETAYENGFYANSERAGKTYKLTKIQFLNGKTIMFEYADAHMTDFNYSQEATMNDLAGEPAGPPVLNTRQSDMKVLTRITTADTRIDFNLAEREDMIPNINNVNNVKRLTSIDITSIAANKKIRCFLLGQSYFSYNMDGLIYQSGQYTPVVINYESYLGKRLKLDNISEIGYADNGTSVNTKPPYVFDYDMSTTMPLKISFSKDFWGYYNGASGNQVLLPDLDYFDYPGVFLANTNNQRFVYTYQVRANRYTDNQKAGAYLLKKITYPTGGYSEFVHEPHTFANTLIPEKATEVFRNHLAQDNSIGGERTITFTLSKQTLIHFENSIRNGLGNYNNVPPLTYSQMQGCYIRFSKIKTVNGSPVTTLLKQWDLSTVLAVDFENNGGVTWNEDMVIAYDPDPTTQYRVETNYPDELNNVLFASIAGVTAHFTYYDDIRTVITESRQCGWRIKNIKNYTAAGVLASNKLITYTGGKLLNRFMPIEMLSDCWFHQCQDSNPEDCPQSVENYFNRLIINSDGMVRDAGQLVGYDKVEELELVNDNATNGKKSVSYHNFENSVDARFQIIVNGLNSLPYNEAVYNAKGEKITEKNYSYLNLSAGAPCYYSITINNHFFGGLDPWGRADIGTKHKYSYNCSPLISEWFKDDSIVSKYYANGVVNTSVEKYTYNGEGSVRTLTTANSKKERIITKYYYPTDNQIDPGVDNQMTALHNTGTPVITEKYKQQQPTDLLLTRDKTVYAQLPNAPTLLPHFIYSKKGQGAEELRVIIDSYDDKGNVTQYTQQNNIPVAIVWNADKTLPIANIENATYASLLALPNGLNSDFRASLPNARVTTYTYKPLVGVVTMTDINNKTTYYEYDAYGRLAVVKDQDGNIIKTHDYHYKQ